MLSRRDWLLGLSSAAVLRGAQMSSVERVNHALKGEDVDRAPFTFWHHFLDESNPGSVHAQSTARFPPAVPYRPGQSDERLSLPQTERRLVRIEGGPQSLTRSSCWRWSDSQRLGGQAQFLETIFNPWNVAEKLSSKKDVFALKNEKPQKLLDALEIIAKSEAAHAKRRSRQALPAFSLRSPMPRAA